MVAAAEDAGCFEAVGQQEERSQKLVHSHHALRQMLHVHVRHLGRLGASDAIVVLDLEKHTPVSKSFLLWRSLNPYQKVDFDDVVKHLRILGVVVLTVKQSPVPMKIPYGQVNLFKCYSYLVEPLLCTFADSLPPCSP